MLGNYWSKNSKDLCDEWKVMCEKGYRWKNIEITWEDTNIDYYVIINFPPKDAFYIPEKTIIFQMEPECAVRSWGKWANPDPKKFLFVGSHKNHLNNIQVQFKQIPMTFTAKCFDKSMIILSAKNFDPGHIKRINLLKNDSKNLIDIYGRKNHHHLRNYKNALPNDNKEDMLVKYKYYFQAENNWGYNYATEKIWEPIVCECLCFYWGCPNLEDYIDPNSFVRLNLDDIHGSLAIIERSIKEDWWSQRIDCIRKTKTKILDDLAFFPTIERIIKKNQEN